MVEIRVSVVLSNWVRVEVRFRFIVLALIGVRIRMRLRVWGLLMVSIILGFVLIGVWGGSYYWG